MASSSFFLFIYLFTFLLVSIKNWTVGRPGNEARPGQWLQAAHLLDKILVNLVPTCDIRFSLERDFCSNASLGLINSREFLSEIENVQ